MAQLLSLVDYRKPPPLRIATILVTGHKPCKVHKNKKHMIMLELSLQHIAASNWYGIDAIILPGGYFFMDSFLGNKKFALGRNLSSATRCMIT